MTLGGCGGSIICGPYLPKEQLTHAPTFGDWLLVGIGCACVLTMLAGLLLGIFAVATGSLRRSAGGTPR